MEPATLNALHHLDDLLRRAVERARALFGADAIADPFKGLHVTTSEVESLLERPPGMPSLWAGGASGATRSGPIEPASRLLWLQRTFGLSSFDMDVVVIALAPDIDLRYERIYAFLQNDVTRRRATVDLALDLLCQSTEDKLLCRARFTSDAPLVRHALIELVADAHHGRPPLLACSIALDDQIVRALLGDTSLDRRLTACCESHSPALQIDELALDEDVLRSLRAVASQAVASPRPIQLYLHGPDTADSRRIAEALATDTGSTLLAVDLLRLATIDALERTLRLVCRQASLQHAVLFVDNLDSLRGEDRRHLLHGSLKPLADHDGITVLAGTQPWIPASDTSLPVITLRIRIPSFHRRRRLWRTCLEAGGIDIDAQDLDALSARFRLSPVQIERSVTLARERLRLHAETDSAVKDLFAAARSQCRHDLAAVTRKIEPGYGWSDIVLPDDSMAQLREICRREVHRELVMDGWGFDQKLSLGKGVNVLFAGPSGTGKTMAAEVIATELGLDLYKIDLAGVVSKYIGETEKNLDRIFGAIENAILFFDEADALFGKRSEVRDSHDRYANLEISYLLQKMEQYEGIAILATNLRQNLDDAFVRRMAFTVHFPFPDAAQRRHIWEQIWPVALPLSPDVDVEFLATQFKLSGGNIKNIALASAFLAAADGGIVTMNHLRHATQREYQKLGKTLSTSELYGATSGAGV